jgi:hypothetical protein
MRLKRSLPGIEHRSIKPTEGLEHLRSDWVAIVRWLSAHKVEHVLIGPVAEAIRGKLRAQGPVTIVPAPYRRNLERLSRALLAEHARQRVDAGKAAGADPVPLKVTAEKLAENTRWTLRCGAYDLDVEGGIRAAGDVPGVPSYQELLYEAGKFELEQGVVVEVASPEDIHHFAHLRRTGVRPEIRITRKVLPQQEPPSKDGPDSAQKPDGHGGTEERENEHDSA